MKKWFILFLTVFVFALSSCWREDTTQSAKNEFSKYFNGKDEVVLNIDDNLYFENYSLDLDGIVKDNEYNGGLFVKQARLYFSTSKQNFMFDYTLNIFESNLDGTNVENIYSKDGFKTHPWAYAIDDVFYIEHYLNNAFDLNSKSIDKYIISTGKYENIANGKESNLSDYMSKEQCRYSIETIENESLKHGEFIVTDLEKNLSKTIDDDYLRNTVYIESMEKYNYGPKRVDISNGHILLTYGIGAGDGWNYPHLVFEYDFDSNRLEYKLLAFPYDNVSINIMYIGEKVK